MKAMERVMDSGDVVMTAMEAIKMNPDAVMDVSVIVMEGCDTTFMKGDTKIDSLEQIMDDLVKYGKVCVTL